VTDPVVFIAADPRECRPWVAHWSHVRDPKLPVHWARAGKWQGQDFLAIANGAGAARAALGVAAADGKPRAIYNIGFCGALDASLGVADIFVAREVRDGANTWMAQEPRGPAAKSGILASIARIAQTAEEKRALRVTGAFAVEMEAAGVARAAAELGVAFYCIRAVSDLAEEGFANDFNGCLTPDGRIDILRLVTRAMASPVNRFGELVRLSRRTTLASESLGEFLANCTY